MRASRLVTLAAACLCAAGAGSARLTAAAKPQAAIAVTVSGLGCSTAVGTDSFEARSWSWGASNVVSSLGGGGGVGKAVLSALTLTRVSDACSPALLGAVVTGKHVGPLSLTQSDGSGAVTATVLLEQVTISEWQIGGSGASAEAAEQVKVSFGKFTYTDVASGNKFSYDLVVDK